MAVEDSDRAQAEEQIAATFTLIGLTTSAQVLAALGNPPDAKRLPAGLLNDFAQSLQVALSPMLQAVYLSSARQLANVNKITDVVNWSAVNERAAAWAEGYSFELVKGINTTTRDKIARLVSQFFRTPAQDLQTLGARIGELFGRERGQMIATTEATRAAAQGELGLALEIKKEFGGQANVVSVWLTSRDEMVCPICAPLHGTRRGRGWTIPPPAHPRCRCALGTELIIKGINDGG